MPRTIYYATTHQLSKSKAPMRWRRFSVALITPRYFIILIRLLQNPHRLFVVRLPEPLKKTTPCFKKAPPPAAVNTKRKIYGN